MGKKMGPLPIDCKKVVAVETLNAEKAYFPLTSEIRRLDSSSFFIIFSKQGSDIFYGRYLVRLLLSSIDAFTHQYCHILGRLSSIPPLGLFIAQICAMSN
jgi:hypothetical protein